MLDKYPLSIVLGSRSLESISGVIVIRWLVLKHQPKSVAPVPIVVATIVMLASGY